MTARVGESNTKTVHPGERHGRIDASTEAGERETLATVVRYGGEPRNHVLRGLEQFCSYCGPESHEETEFRSARSGI